MESSFQTSQAIGFLAFPISYVSLVLGTISWHFHHRENIMNNLKISQKLRVFPFFLVIITTKVWALADFFNTVWDVLNENNLESNGIILSASVMLPFLVILCVQTIVHRAAKCTMEESVLGSLANVISLCRPTHEESQAGRVLTLYEYEIRASSILYAIMGGITTAMKVLILEREGLSTWISMSLAFTFVVTTQLYMKFGKDTLFPEMVEGTKDQNNAQQEHEIKAHIEDKMSFEDLNESSPSTKKKCSVDDKDMDQSEKPASLEELDIIEDGLETVGGVKSKGKQRSRWNLTKQTSREKFKVAKEKLAKDDNWIHIPSSAIVFIQVAITFYFAWQLVYTNGKDINNRAMTLYGRFDGVSALHVVYCVYGDASSM